MLKFESFIILLFFSFMSNIESQSFCEDGRVNTTFTYGNHTFLFRKNKIWTFEPNACPRNQFYSMKHLLVNFKSYNFMYRFS